MDTLQAGISAAREGRHAEARALLQQALQADARSEQGWLWMSAVVETDDERRICLERVLTVNPNNQTARAGLEKLSAPDSSGHDAESYLPVSRSIQPQADELRQTVVPVAPTSQVAESPSPHGMPTLGMTPVVPSYRPIQRLSPQPEPTDGWAELRAAQFQPPAEPDDSSSESDPFMALVLIGGLSVTALAGGLMLVLLWLIGWPP